MLAREETGAVAASARPVQGRRWFAPEFLVVAALLAATLGGRWLFEPLHEAEPRAVQAPPLEHRTVVSNEEAEALYDEALRLTKTKAFDSALVRLERCTRIAPEYAACYKTLGSVLAKIAARDSSPGDMEKARRAYERFLELASPDDDAVPKVRAILESQ